MTTDAMSWLPGIKTVFWAPQDEGAGGGSTGEGEGGDKSGDGGEGQSTETVLGGSEEGEGQKTDDQTEGGEGGEAEKEGDDGGEKTDGEKDEEGEKDKGADEVPEDGSYEFDLPDGVQLGDEEKQLWSEQFKEMGLTRAQAQALVEKQSQQVIEEQQATAKRLADQQQEHLDAAKKDPEIGGDKWAETTKLANAGLKLIGSDALKDLILATGNGNNPEILRGLRRVGQLSAEDKFEPGSSHETPVSTESSWYGGTTPDSKKG